MDEKVRSVIQLVALLQGKPLNLKSGEVLFEQGQPGTQMFVVQSGALELHVNGKPVGTVGPGGVIGEMAIVDHGPRSATAVAAADTALFPIDAPQFDKLVQNVPGFAREIIGILVRRLRQEKQALIDRPIRTPGRRYRSKRSFQYPGRRLSCAMATTWLWLPSDQ